MKLIAQPEHVFGSAYDVGWGGFVAHGGIIATGIEWFTRWWRTARTPAVDHVIGVTREGWLVEANADGVDDERLSEYFEAPAFTVYFRKPRGWTPDLGARIARTMSGFIGESYDFPLIGVDALENSFLGRALNGLTHDEMDEWLTAAAANPREKICNMVLVCAYQAQPEMAGRGCLGLPAARTNPQMVFEDEAIWEPEVYVVKGSAPVPSRDGCGPGDGATAPGGDVPGDGAGKSGGPADAGGEVMAKAQGGLMNRLRLGLGGP